MILPRAVSGGSLLAAAAILIAPLPPGFTPEAANALAVAVGAVGLWASGVVPEHVTALGFFLAADLLRPAPREALFAGFASGAVWLVFAGLILAAGVRRTGLAERLARSIGRWTPPTYAGVIGALVFVGTALCFIMPSSIGRVALFVPIVAALAERFGFTPGSNGRTGMLLAASFGTILPGFAVLPANVPNLVLVGAAEQLYGVAPGYAGYLALHFPVSGLLKGVLIVAVILALFPDRPRFGGGDDAPSPAPPAQRKLALLLGVTLVLWAGDAWHHISPAWIGLAAALVCLLPGFRIVTVDDVGAGHQIKPIVHTAAIMGLGTMVASSGLGDVLSRSLLDLMSLAPGRTAGAFAQVVGSSAGLGLFTALTGMPAVMTPLAAKLAAAAGLPLMSVLMMLPVAFSTVILPYQLPPLVIGMHLAGLRTRDGAKACLVLAFLTFVLLAPLNYYWFRLLGYLP